ncbi:hypothetical protein KIW84_064391 [Lathyrus oleraceus]|uniref:Uncharacterized protein n=1 Tax=Pisum sativum TaxID=3888 RepID=A0A9D4WE81_PEA|nr:hypothetical protein KIW84_064391 [Pisum sativum]
MTVPILLFLYVMIQQADNNLPELQPADNNLPELQPADNNLPALQPSDNNLLALQPSDNTLCVPHTLNSGSPSNLLINDNLSPSSPVQNSPPSPLSISLIHPLVNINDDQPPIRHSTRAFNPPSYLADYHCFSTSANPSSSKVTYPVSSVLSYNNCSPDFHHFCCSISSNPEPSSFLQANKFECWKHAMNVELQALDDNHTWTLMDLPPGKASRQWYAKLSSFLISIGYSQSQADCSLYVKSTSTSFIALLVPGDDRVYNMPIVSEVVVLIIGDIDYADKIRL